MDHQKQSAIPEEGEGERTGATIPPLTNPKPGEDSEADPPARKRLKLERGEPGKEDYSKMTIDSLRKYIL